MKESDEKEKHSEEEKNSIEEYVDKLVAEGVWKRGKLLPDEHILILNPSKSLVDKLRKEKGDKKGS